MKTTNFDNIAIVILAAGLGTRMKSDKAKVLHEILNTPMIMYVLKTATAIAGNNVVVVIGHQAEKVKKIVSQAYDVMFAIQEKQLGTGHAVLCALPGIPKHVEDVLILCGDVPLITTDTLSRLIREHRDEKRDISLLAVEMDEPRGYGRVIFDKNKNIAGIVEESDATAEQKTIKMINTGIYCIKTQTLTDSLHKIKSGNAQGEYYLTDIIKIGYDAGKRSGVLIAKNGEEFIGVNAPEHIITVENIMRKKIS